MKKSFFIYLIAILFYPVFASAQLSSQWADTLNGLFQQKSKFYNVKSAAAAIAFPDGSVWKSAYGMTGSDPTSPDMLFEIGSNTKTFTATMILQLADEGKLKLNDTIYKFLPLNPNIAYGITIRQLLNHTSGIYDYTEHPGFFDFVNGDENATIDIDSVLKMWLKPMIFKPGAKWSYCNTNYLLLGKIIEALDGVSYEKALRKRILDKFGFKETFFAPFEHYSLTKAGTWLSNGVYFGTEFKNFMSAAWAAGAIYATPSDLAIWARSLYRGDILPHSWLDSMRQTIKLSSTTAYGLGMFERKYFGKTYLGHGGTTLQNSDMDYSLSSDFSCVVIVNEQGRYNEPRAIQNALISLVENLIAENSGIAKTSVENQLKVFPNPARESFSIELNPAFLNKSSKSIMKIYAVDGSLVSQSPVNESTIKVDRGDLKNGLYLIRISNEDGNLLAEHKLFLN